MAPVYDVELVREHALVSRAARELQTDDDLDEPDVFTSHQIVAESLLGVGSTAYTDNALKKAVIAIVRQINFQVEQGLEPLYLESASSSAARSSKQFRDRWTDPVALQLFQSIDPTAGVVNDLARFHGTLRSHRTDDGGSNGRFDPNLTDRILSKYNQ